MRIIKKSLLIGALSLFALMAVAGGVSAGITNPESGALPSATPDVVIKNIFDLVALIIGAIAALMVVIGGVMWMTAGGDEERAATARKMIISGVVGLIIVGAAVGLVRFVLKIF